MIFFDSSGSSPSQINAILFLSFGRCLSIQFTDAFNFPPENQAISPFSIFVFLVSLLFINPDVRANFAESFTQVVDSLRGVERRADVINVVQPPEIEIDLTNVGKR